MVAGDHVEGERQAPWVEGNHHRFDLPERPIIFPLTELPQARFAPFSLPWHGCRINT